MPPGGFGHLFVPAPASVVIDVPPNVQGRFQAQQIRHLSLLWQNQANDPFISLEQNPHFVGRFTAQQINHLRGLIQNQANDLPVPQPPESAQPVTGRFTPLEIRHLRALWQNSANDIPIIPPPPPPVAPTIPGPSAGGSGYGSRTAPGFRTGRNNIRAGMTHKDLLKIIMSLPPGERGDMLNNLDDDDIAFLLANDDSGTVH